MRKLLLLLGLLLLPWQGAQAQPPAADTPTGTDAVRKAQDEATSAFLARFPKLPATASRIGNSGAGTTEVTPTDGISNTFPDGAPVRLAVPTIATRVGLETSPDGKTVLLRVWSPWNEGGWHNTYIDPNTGKVVGGMWDVPFPRLDIENRTAENSWEFGTGWWMISKKWGPLTTGDYRAGIPFKELKQGPDSGVKGYTWTSSDAGLVITTPKRKIYGLVGFQAAVTDPDNANLVFTLHNSHTINWGAKGDGKEETTFAPSFDYGLYPHDPRRNAKAHPGPIAAVRRGGELYVYTAGNEVMVHRWDAKAKLLVPVAAAYFRPDEFHASIPDTPKTEWGQGAIVRFLNGVKWEVFNAGSPIPLWNGYLFDVDPEGDLYFLPSWREIKDALDGAVWRVLDVERGVFSVENIKPLVLPDALKTASQCAQIRIDWKTGDLLAVAMRDGVWNLERYPKWRDSAHNSVVADSPKSVKAAYSVGPVALSLRREYPWYAQWNAKWGASTSPEGGVPTAGFGTMAVCGDYVFIAEAQAGGVRVHRLSDGRIVGRASGRLHTNSTIDSPTQMQVRESPTEYRVFLMDFHGKSTLVWRIPKKSLK